MLKDITQRDSQNFKSEAKRLLDASKVDVANKSKEGKKDGAVTDRVTIQGQKPEGVTYSPALSDVDLEAKYTLLRNLVVDTLQEQGVASRIALGNSEIDISTLSVEDAQALVAEDGYFGVEKTSQRMFDFVVGLAQNDPSRLDAIRRGIADGFAEAEKAWGGTLPEISYQTRDALMEKLDQWEQGFTAAT